MGPITASTPAIPCPSLCLPSAALPVGVPSTAHSCLWTLRSASPDRFLPQHRTLRAPPCRALALAHLPTWQLLSQGNSLQQFFDNTPQIVSYPSLSSSAAHTHHTSTLPPLPPSPSRTLHPKHADSRAAQAVSTELEHPLQNPHFKSPC